MKYEKQALGVVLALFIILGSIYALTTPAFEASDELWHYPMIRHLADGNPLPVQVFDPNLAGPWKQEASQPPLYYYIGAALTFWIDASDMETVRWENPHVDNGIITADGNVNLIIHDPDLNPWAGALLAIRIVRLASVLMGAVTVYFTYRIGREVMPERPEIGLGAAIAVAFNPMFLFISGAVNNDNLVIPLATLALFLMVRLVRGEAVSPAVEKRKLLILGVVIGLGALTKITAVGLLPLAFGTVFIYRWERSDKGLSAKAMGRLLGETIGRFLIVLLPVLVIAGWWYWRNIELYGDWSGWNAFIAVLGQRATPASIAQLWDERWGFMLSYWGLFGGVNIPMATWIYYLLNLVVVLAVPGFIFYLIKERGRLAERFPVQGQGFVEGSLRWLFDMVSRNFPLVLAVLWSVAVVVGLIQWATTTWSSQGRLVFSAIGTLNILMIVGLVGWMRQRTAVIVVSVLFAFLLIISASAPFVWIQPAYQVADNEVPENVVPKNLTIVDQDFGGKLRLVGYELLDETAQPGQAVEVVLVWDVLERMERNWSVFVHLNDPVVGTPVAQRDMFLGQGLLATTFLEPGEQIVNHYQLMLSSTTYAPGELALTVGLYDYKTVDQERLPTVDGADAAVLDTIVVEPLEGAYPNPVNINFENQVALVGYDLTPRRAVAGESFEVTLYFEPLKPFEADYTVFAQVVDQDTTRWASDDQGQTTSQWMEGEVAAVSLNLNLNEETPAGVYPVIVGLYIQTADGAFDRLQIMTAEGRLTDDFLNLTQVRVD